MAVQLRFAADAALACARPAQLKPDTLGRRPSRMTVHVQSREIFVRLVRARDRDECVRRDVPVEQCPPETVWITFCDDAGTGEMGRYHDGAVFLYRPNCVVLADQRAVEMAQASTNPVDELVWFAHELGHHESRRSGFPAPGSEPTLDTEDQKRDRYAEEARAWLWARAILTGEGLSGWERFDELQEVGLSSYVRGLPASAIRTATSNAADDFARTACG
jgi:hypothetical protein